MQLQPSQLQLIQEWNEAKQQLNKWQETESTLRVQVVTELFNAETTEGTENIELAGNWKLKATKGLNYNLSNKDGALMNILATLPSLVAENLIRWKPDLNLGIYRKLDQHTQELFRSVLTVTSSKPKLELVPPS